MPGSFSNPIATRGRRAPASFIRTTVCSTPSVAGDGPGLPSFFTCRPPLITITVSVSVRKVVIPPPRARKRTRASVCPTFGSKASGSLPYCDAGLTRSGRRNGFFDSLSICRVWIPAGDCVATSAKTVAARDLAQVGCDNRPR